MGTTFINFSHELILKVMVVRAIANNEYYFRTGFFYE